MAAATRAYFGGGLLLREERGNSYVEGSLAAGRTRMENSSPFGGQVFRYQIHAPYYGLHFGMGEKHEIGAGSLDCYGRVFYSYTRGTSSEMKNAAGVGYAYHFDAVESLRFRFGTRYERKIGNITYDLGAAWEYQISGAAKASYRGASTASPSLKGGSVLVDLGASWSGSKGELRLGTTLWAGKMRGVEMNAQAKIYL